MGTGMLPDWQSTQEELAPDRHPTFISTPDENRVSPDEWMPEAWDPAKRERLFRKRGLMNLAFGLVPLVLALLIFWGGAGATDVLLKSLLWFIALLFGVCAVGRLGSGVTMLTDSDELSPKPDVVVRRFVTATLDKGPCWDPVGAMPIITPVGRVGLQADSPERFWECCDKAVANIATQTSADAAAFAMTGMHVACLDAVPRRRHRLSRAVVDIDTRAQTAGQRILFLMSGFLFQPLIALASRSAARATCRLNLDLIQAPNGDWYVAQLSYDFRRLKKSSTPQSAEY